MAENPSASEALRDDAPLSPERVLTDDRYGLAPYGYLLARVIAEAHGRSGFTIALDAPWGAGKTSVAKLAEFLMAGESAMRSGSAAFGGVGHGAAEVEAFMRECRDGVGDTPWRFEHFESWTADGTDLAFELYDRLWEVKNEDLPLGPAGRGEGGQIVRWLLRKPARIGQALNAAGGLASLATLGVIPPPNLSTEGQGDPRREEDDLGEWLSKRRTPLVLVVDDIDRLPPPQVAALMSALWYLRRFEKLVLVLLRHHDRVASALAHGMFAGGDRALEEATQFLEKIVQVSIALPAPPEDLLVRTFMEDLGLPEAHGEERARWDGLRRLILREHLTTPRAVARLANALRVTRIMLPKDAIDPRELVAVEALRLFDPVGFPTLRAFARDIADADRDGRALEIEEAEAEAPWLPLLFPTRFGSWVGEGAGRAFRPIAPHSGERSIDDAERLDLYLGYFPSTEGRVRFSVGPILAGDEEAWRRATARIAGAPPQTQNQRPSRRDEARDLRNAIEDAILGGRPEWRRDDRAAAAEALGWDRRRSGGAVREREGRAGGRGRDRRPLPRGRRGPPGGSCDRG